MERSQDEQLRSKFRLTRINRMLRDISTHLQRGSEELLPMSFKETSPVVPSAAMVLPGEWQELDSKLIPSHNENSIIWLRKRFSLPEPPQHWIWCLDLHFLNCNRTGRAVDKLMNWEEEQPVEGAIWIDGVIRQGISFSRQLTFLDNLSTDQEHELTLRLNYQPWHKDRCIKHCAFTQMHLPSFKLHERLKCIHDIVEVLEDTSPATISLIKLLDDTLRKIPFTDPGSDAFYEAIAMAWEEFSFPAEWEKVQATVKAFGHAHIDVAWLWNIMETRRKAVQTFANTTDLLERYPDYVFFQSQPVLYEFAEQQEPALFERLTKYVQEGRWIPEGAMWVESDCNIPSGESLVRQFLYGKRYIREKFGKEMSLLWLPDTFGFNANLPQIMKKCGIPYFSTSKISWSDSTRFPYDAFRWRGIDGSEVLAMFLTAHHKKFQKAATYNGWLTPGELKFGWDTFAQKDIFDEILLSFGYGDGGGGPVREMLERAPIFEHAPGIPNLTMGSPVDTFKKLDAVRDKLPAWHGELYLQYHRGTYTSRSKIKYYHRRAENALSLLEKAISFDMLIRRRNLTDDEKETLDYLWKILLTNEFHDIIAGSSIHEVNEEATEDLARIADEANRKARNYICSWNWEGKEQSEKGSTDGEVIFNPHSFPVAQIKGDREKNICYLTFEPPFCFASPHTLTDRGVLFSPVKVIGDDTVETGYMRVKINKIGEIVSLVDQRVGPYELIKPGAEANKLRFYQDRPLDWDAWDINDFYKEFPLEETTLDQAGWTITIPTRAVYRTVKKFRQSTIIQDMTFYAHTPRIDFRTRIDWHNKNVLIKAEFPFNLNTAEAMYEIPFGFVKRPTHSNLPAEKAQFEVPAQRWGAMFETGRGAAVLNDSKYGYSAEGSTLSLSLLKSAVYPDPDAEENIHEFKYALLPCFGSQPTSEIIWEATLLNQPVLDINAGCKNITMAETPPLEPLPRLYAQSNGNHVILDSIKPAEDGKGIIIRMYEALNRRGEAHISLPRQSTGVTLVTLTEEPIEELPVQVLTGDSGGEPGIVLHFEPFEIRSIRLIFETE